jgi:16S rRNA processing protein RimM
LQHANLQNVNQPNESPRWVIVARVLRARGNKGEVAAELLTDFPERLTHLREVFLAAPNSVAAPRAVAVQSCWISKNHVGQAVFHFGGSSSIDDAEKFRGLEVLLPIEQRVTLPAGHYFVSDLVGCSVFEASLPEAAVGVVSDVQFPGEGNVAGTPLLEILTPQGELLVPLAEEICTRIDVANRRIEVVMPEGLRDLNPLE